MGDYKDRVFYCGGSDIASLTVRFPGRTEVLNTGEDGDYKAYVVFDEEAEIPEYYKKVLEGEKWCWIFDDDERVLSVKGEKISIYRAGERGILIHATGEAYADGNLLYFIGWETEK